MFKLIGNDLTIVRKSNDRTLISNAISNATSN